MAASNVPKEPATKKAVQSEMAEMADQVPEQPVAKVP